MAEKMKKKSPEIEIEEPTLSLLPPSQPYAWRIDSRPLPSFQPPSLPPPRPPVSPRQPPDPPDTSSDLAGLPQSSICLPSSSHLPPPSTVANSTVQSIDLSPLLPPPPQIDDDGFQLVTARRKSKAWQFDNNRSKASNIHLGDTQPQQRMKQHWPDLSTAGHGSSSSGQRSAYGNPKPNSVQKISSTSKPLCLPSPPPPSGNNSSTDRNSTMKTSCAWKDVVESNQDTFCVPKMSEGKDQPMPIYLDMKMKSSLSAWRPKSTESDSKKSTAVAGTASLPSSSLADNNNQSKRTSVDTSISDDCSGKCSVSLEVGASLIRFVKGIGGSTQQQIEEETGTKILFSSRWKDNHIVIEGTTNESITKASEKIAIVLEEAIKSSSHDYSHFISLPLAIHPEVVDRLQNFQNAVLGCSNNLNEGKSDDKADEKSTSCSDAGSNAKLGIDKSIFIMPRTFHLTILMLKLWNKDRFAAATEVLQKISSEVHEALDNRPVFVRLQGLECMQGSPAKARVVYAPVEEVGAEGRLLNACKVITEAYIEAGLVLQKDAHHTLKLHATIINAGHRKRSYNHKKRDTFDSSNIFSKYGSENWGEYIIREAHLSERFKYDENGYYHCCASLPFPGSVQVE